MQILGMTCYELGRNSFLGMILRFYGILVKGLLQGVLTKALMGFVASYFMILR